MTPVISAYLRAGAGGLLLAAAAGCGQGGAPAPPPPQVAVITVASSDVPIFDEWVGQIRGAADIEIRARVPGFI